MIIPHEDTYWNDADNTLIAEADTLVYKTKIDFMTKHDIVVFRIHDHMHRQRPDFTFSGTAREVGLDPVDGNGAELAPVRHSGDDARRARGAGEEGPRRRRHPRRRRSEREGAAGLRPAPAWRRRR